MLNKELQLLLLLLLLLLSAPKAHASAPKASGAAVQELLEIGVR